MRFLGQATNNQEAKNEELASEQWTRREEEQVSDEIAEEVAEEIAQEITQEKEKTA